jgi:hypothetical protein
MSRQNSDIYFFSSVFAGKSPPNPVKKWQKSASMFFFMKMADGLDFFLKIM